MVSHARSLVNGRPFARLVAAIAAVAALLLGMPAAALAEDAEEQLVTLEIPAQEVRGQEDDTDDAADLLEGFIEQRFARELPSDELVAQSTKTYLSGNDMVAYTLLKPMIAEVASGQRTSTVFEIPISELAGKTTFTAADLGVDSIFVNDQINEDALAAVREKISFDLNKVFDALLADCPYELYWYDKIAGLSQSSPSLSFSGRYIQIVGNITVSMCVSSDYAAGTYEVDPTMGQCVEAAVADAKAVVSASAGKSAYDRLAYFKQAICDRVSYNTAAAGGSVAFGDPWQLVSVFDGDSSTNVVCEGYAKAFKYLCDLADITRVECRLATGVMTGGTGSGGHMWNVVQMDDQRNYLVDVTNCDTGTVGADSLLFLVPYGSGSVADGYTFKAGSNTIGYVYDSETLALFTTDELTISSTAYAGPIEPEPEPVNMADVQVAPIPDQLYSGQYLDPDVTLTYDGTVLEPGVDYTREVKNSRNAGAATIVFTGLGDYDGETSVTFQILPRNVTLTSDSASKVYDGQPLVADNVTVTGDGFVGSDAISFVVTGAQTMPGSSDNTFTFSLGSGTLASNYSITVVYGTLTVEPCDPMYQIEVKAPSDTVTYDGQVYGLAARLVDTYTFDGKTYTLGGLTASASGADAGTYEVKVAGEPVIRDAEGNDVTWLFEVATVSGTLKIEPRALHITTGSARKTYDGTPLTCDEVTVEGLVNGDATVMVTGTKTDAGEASNDYEITWTAGKAGNYVLEDELGKLVVARRSATVRANDLSKAVGDPDPQLTASVSGVLDGDTLTYDISRVVGEDEGTYQILVTGAPTQGNYQVTYYRGTLTIARNPITSVTGAVDATYMGTAITQKALVVRAGDTVLTAGDYEVSYTNNVNAGTVTLTVTGTGAYAGTVSTSFVIHPKDVTVRASNASKTFGEQDPQLSATVEGTVGDDGVAYTLSRVYGEDAGTYAITATGTFEQGNYRVSFQGASFVINPASLSGAAVRVEDQTFSGSALTPAPVVTLSDKTLVAGTDYEVAYADNTAVGTATVTVTGEGNYTGTASGTFQIVAPDEPPAPEEPFFVDNDPANSTSHGAEVEWMGRVGISTGWDTANGKEFRGLKSVTRCDFAAFLYRLADLSDDGERNDSIRLTNAEVTEVLAGVSDCTSRTDHAMEVAWMIKSGISRGWEDKGKKTVSFRPMANVARQDMAAFLYRYADIQDDGAQNQSLDLGSDTIAFKDVRHGDGTNHAPEVEWLASVGVTKGWGPLPDGTYQFRGTRTVARQDMAAFMYRLNAHLNR